MLTWPVEQQERIAWGCFTGFSLRRTYIPRPEAHKENTMVIIWGEMLYGTVDQVGSLFYVRTRFFYVYWIPLIPVRSFVVHVGSERSDGFQGRPIPMSGKSVLAGWLRAGCIIGLIISAAAWLFCALNLLRGKMHVLPRDLLAWSGMLLGSGLVYWSTLFFKHASYERALELGEVLGIPRDVIAEIYVTVPGASLPEDADPSRSLSPEEGDH
jgi:hypothetical protein